MITDIVVTDTVVPTTQLYQWTEDAYHAFGQADIWGKQGLAILFDIYTSQLWRAEAEDWEEWLRGFILECHNRGISTVSVETLQQRTRDYVRLVVGAGVALETVLNLPVSVANRIATLGTWPRQGTKGYDPEAEGTLTEFSSPAVRKHATQFYDLAPDASDAQVLSTIVERLAEMPSAGAGLAEIERLTRGGESHDEFKFVVEQGKSGLVTTCHYTHFIGPNVNRVWSGDVSAIDTPDVVLVEYARRLGTSIVQR